MRERVARRVAAYLISSGIAGLFFWHLTQSFRDGLFAFIALFFSGVLLTLREIWDG